MKQLKSKRSIYKGILTYERIESVHKILVSPNQYENHFIKINFLVSKNDPAFI